MKLKLSALVFASLWVAGNAMGAITLDNSGTNPVQQTSDNPCILGGNDCGSSFPAGWSWTDTNANDNDGAITGMEGYSPTYDYDLFHPISGDFFSVGIDTNQAGTGDDDRLNLQTFEMWVNGGLVQSWLGGPAMINLNNGTGFTDAKLDGWSLAGYGSGDLIQFRTTYNNATDGADSFFVIPVTAPIPEPEVYAMLGVGLALMGWVGRRRKLQADA